MKLVYVHHSGFYLEIEDKVLIFDNIDHGLINKLTDCKDKDGYIFVTHKHGDHYDNNIWALRNCFKNTKYIFGERVDKEGYDIFNMLANQESNIGDLNVKTTASTDRGVSFLIKTKGETIYHAGDLNWWYWKNDDDYTHKKEERDYKVEIEKLLGEDIDVAMVPVDPRLEEYYYLAGKYFIEELKPKNFFPMHFSTNFDITNKFKDFMDKENNNTNVYEINRIYQEFILD